MGLLPAFLKAAECGSFVKAGAALGVSPSSISRQIDKLEADLATKLLRRSTRNLTLTSAGELLMERARRAMYDLDSVCAQVRASSVGAPRGELRISMLESFGRLRVCPLLPGFLAQYPEVKIDVQLDNSMANLYRDDIDLAIRIGVPLDSRLKARKLLDNTMVLCASAAYLAQRGVPGKPEELIGHNCLALTRNGMAPWWYFSRGEESEKIRATGNLSSMGGTPLLAAALQGVGITMLADWIVGDALQHGTLVSLLDGWRPQLNEEGSGQVYAVFLNNEHMKPALRALIDYLAAHLPAAVYDRVGGFAGAMG